MLDLTSLIGTWRGEGKGEFPTIEPFRFDEIWQVTGRGDSGLVHYEQQTTIIPEGRPSHWESGFLIQEQDEDLQWTFADNSGRFGVFTQTHFAERGGNAWDLHMTTVQTHNDARVIALTRKLSFHGNHIHYKLFMAATTTTQPGALRHLTVDLYRQP